MNSRIKFLVVVSSTCLVLLLLIGSVLGKTASPDDAYKHIAVYTEVLQRIKSEYVEEPDMKSVTLGALNGLLESIDPFASYLNAEQYRDYLKEKDKKRADVGLILSKRSGYLGVVGVVPNSPAAKAGMGTLDMIESIKGIGTRDMPLAYAALMLQGESGSSIDLSVVRWRRMEPQTVKLTRAMVTYPPVSFRMLPNQIGYLNAQTLASNNVKELAADLANLEKQGAQKLVLDLRGCAVGDPEDGIALANLFLNKGIETYLQGQRMPRKNFEADPSKAVATKLPMVVLTNHGTADAAEIAAAALLDNKRADVVGERTYGDASERRVITMDDGGAIILSVAKYYSPSGKAIQDAGVTPNNLLNEPEAQVEFDENGEPLPEAPNAAPKKSDDDPLLKKAVEILNSKAAV